MPEFRTPLEVTRSPFTITLHDSVLTIGSCFSDIMGERLRKNKFLVSVNPFGTIYNPLSLHKVLRYTIYNELPDQHTYLKNRDIFSNYDFHSSFSALQPKQVEDKIKEIIGFNHFFLKDCKYLIITYGTAWAYKRLDTEETVANCHKMPAQNFSKYLLHPESVTESFDSLYKELKAFNPGIKIILTVSPVRHVKETLDLNSLSKAILRLACHSISEKYDQVEYFPSYEIMIDDLRDYRFYRSDMIHPSQDAEDYIWKKFSDCYFDDNTKHFLEKWKTLSAALSHKPFHPQSAAHQQFLRDTLKSLEALQSIIPVEAEIKSIQSQLVQYS